MGNALIIAPELIARTWALLSGHAVSGAGLPRWAGDNVYLPPIRPWSCLKLGERTKFGGLSSCVKPAEVEQCVTVEETRQDLVARLDDPRAM